MEWNLKPRHLEPRCLNESSLSKAVDTPPHLQTLRQRDPPNQTHIAIVISPIKSDKTATEPPRTNKGMKEREERSERGERRDLRKKLILNE